MSLNFTEDQKGRIFEITAKEWLTHADYLATLPEIARMIKRHGKISLIFHMDHFEGWQPVALLDDLKFDVSHFKDIERLAIVGLPTARKRLADFHKRLSHTLVEYFRENELEKARAWMVVHWTTDDWQTSHNIPTLDTGLGIHYADLETSDTAPETDIFFTFQWLASDHWEGHNFLVTVE